MERTKRFLCILLAMVLLLSSLAGCSSGEETVPTETEQKTTTENDVATTVPENSETPTEPAVEADGVRFTYSGAEGVEVGEPVDFQSSMDRAPGDAVAKENTVMIYIVGSDLESKGAAASTDIAEMYYSGVDLTKTNVIIYTGGSSAWHLNTPTPIPSDMNVIWELTADERALNAVGYTETAVPMGNAETFAGFLNFTYENFPAQHYALICWDHGGGPLGGYGNDELFGNDPLYLPEMAAALENSYFAQNRLDLFGFDACLMADAELAWLAQPYARYLVASQELEPGCGWDYSFLKMLNTGTMEDMAAEILRTYETSMLAMRPQVPQYTLSWIDLDQMDGVTSAMDDLFNEMSRQLVAGDFNQLSNLRKDTYSYATKAVSSVSQRLDLIDVGHMTQQLSTLCPEQTAALQQALNGAVLRSVSNIRNASGLSMYYPYDSKVRFEKQAGDMVIFEYNRSEGYRNYMEGYLGYWLYNEPNTQWLAEQQLTVEEETQPVTPPATEPATEPTTQPATQPATEPATQPATEPVTPPATEPATQPTDPPTQPAGENLVMTLPMEHLDSVSEITYSVLRYDPDMESYYPVLHNVPVKPDAQGTVRVPRNPQVYVAISDADGRQELWPIQYAGLEEGVTYYTTLGACLLPSTDVISAGMDPIHIVLSQESAQAQPKVQSVTSRDDSVNAALGRQNVDLNRWGVVGYSPIYIQPTQNEQGQLLPINQWQQESWFAMYMKNYDDYFYFNTSTLAQQKGDFYCVLTIKDTCGNVIATRMEPMQGGAGFEDKEIATEKGTMTFRVYEDHAELYRYEGEDEALEVPAEVDGVKVSVIGADSFMAYSLTSVTLPDTVTNIDQNAFSGCYKLEHVKLPSELKVIEMSAFAYTALKELTLGEKVTRIGDNAFAGTDITAVVLPAGLVRLGERAFANCDNLTQIMIIGSSKYISVDGVLFSADGKELLVYPTGRAGEYTVPEGTQRIGPAAFNGAKQLTGVTFPEGLTMIDRLAFQDALNIASFTFPESLTTIGEAAFGCSIGNVPVVQIPELYIGKNITTVGTSAFRGYLVGAFRVDPENAEYSSINGCLLNKSGTRLYQAPHGLVGKLEVPMGVSLVDWRAFDFCNGITEIVIPDSVVLIDHAAGVPKALTKITIGRGLLTWENLWSYTSAVTVEIHPDNPSYTVVDGNVYSKDLKTLLFYMGSEEEFRIPDSVEAVHSKAFSQYGLPITTLHIGSNVQTIPENCFQYLKQLTQICCPAGSAAEAYANEHGLTVVTE